MSNPVEPQRAGFSLQRRLLISALLGVVPLFLLGIFLLMDRYNSHRDLIKQNNLSVAQLAAVYVQGWLEGHIRTLNTLADSAEVQNGNIPEMRGLIQRQLHAQPEWQALFITDTAGKVIAANDPRLRDASDRDYFLRAKRTGRPVVSNLLTSKVNGQLVIVISCPVMRQGSFAGIMATAITPSTIQALFAQITITGNTFISLWGSDRRLIARTNTPENMIGKWYDVKGMEQVLSGRSGTMTVISPLTQQRMLIGYAPVRAAPWTAVVGTPLRVALAPIVRNMILFVVLTVLVLMATLLWSVYSANAVARQVSLLAKSARAIGEGHFATRVTLHSGDELEDLANSLNKLATDLAVADRMKSDLVGMVSHELKTPLTSILASLEVLSGIQPDDPQYGKLLSIAERQARRLQDMIENLISVARMEAGGFTVTPRPTALSSIIRASATEYEHLARNRGLAFSVEIPAEIRVLADAAKVTLALNNLLDNAVKFSEEGSIVVRAQVQDQQVAITVTDTGKGLTPETRARLFEKFYQAEPLLTRKAGGAGLGLLVAKTIIEAHGGHMIVESDGPGHGSTFGFTLPLAPSAVH